MTTVCYARGVLAGDTLAIDAHGLKYRSTKVRREALDFGFIAMYGGSGVTTVCRRVGAGVMKHLRQKLAVAMTVFELDDVVCAYDPKDSDDKDNDCDAVLAVQMLDRTVRLYHKQATGFIPITVRPFHACGSGRDFALASVALGKEADEAVRIAMEFDAGTGGEVEVIKFNR